LFYIFKQVIFAVVTMDSSAMNIEEEDNSTSLTEEELGEGKL